MGWAADNRTPFLRELRGCSASVGTALRLAAEYQRHSAVPHRCGRAEAEVFDRDPGKPG